MMKLSKKALALMMALVLVVGCAVGGAVAWLTEKTEPVTNTFTPGRLVEEKADFSLMEHVAVRGENGAYALTQELTTANTYSVLPGVNLPKDPFISLKNVEEAYLYVEVVDALPETLTYAMDTNWVALKDGATAVTGPHGGEIYAWNVKLPAVTDAKIYNILKDKQIVVSSSFTAPVDVPADYTETLSFYGYLAQGAGQDTALSAWKAANFTV